MQQYLCYECGKPLGERQFTSGVHLYCFECGYTIANCVRTAQSLLRKKLNPQEYYITPEIALDALVDLLNHQDMAGLLPEGSLIWEPCNGNRRIGDFLQEQGFRIISSDIYPRDIGVTKADFLKTTNVCEAIVFNPPFNAFRNSHKWLKHALDCARIVIALLPHNMEANKAKFSDLKPFRIQHIPGNIAFDTPYEEKPLKKDCNWYAWDRENLNSIDTLWDVSINPLNKVSPPQVIPTIRISLAGLNVEQIVDHLVNKEIRKADATRRLAEIFAQERRNEALGRNKELGPLLPPPSTRWEAFFVRKILTLYKIHNLEINDRRSKEGQAGIRQALGWTVPTRSVDEKILLLAKEVSSDAEDDREVIKNLRDAALELVRKCPIQLLPDKAYGYIKIAMESRKRLQDEIFP